MRRRTILQHPLDLFNLIVSLSLAAVLVVLALQPGPQAVITMAPEITAPRRGDTVGADELQALEGTADPGVRVQVFDGDQLLGETVGTQDGTFRFGLDSALSPGPHSVRAVVLNRNGQEIVDSELVAFTIVPPAEPTLPPLITSPESGASLGSDDMPAFEGSTKPGATVRIYDGESLLGEVEAGSDGRWRWQGAETLASGSHELRAVLLDRDGREAIASDAVPFTVNPIVPLLIVSPGSGGSVAAGELLALNGTASPGAVVRFYDGTEPLGEATTDSGGKWRFKLSEALAAGEHALRAVVVDSDDQEAAASEVFIFTVDQPVILPLVVAPGAESPLTEGDQPTFEGSAAPGATVRIYDGETLLGEATAAGDGTWHFAPSVVLAAGEHSLRAVVLDSNGHEAVASDVYAFTVEEPVRAPSIVSPADGSTVGVGDPLQLEGTASPGVTVRVYEGEALLGEAVVGDGGTWQLELSQPLKAGVHTLRAAVLDAAGDQAATSGSVAVEFVDLSPRPAFLLPVTGELVVGGEVEGTAKPGTLLRIYDGDTVLGESTANAYGTWSYFLPDDLSTGEHVLWIEALDSTGEVLAESERAKVVLLEPAPTVTPVMIRLSVAARLLAGETIEGTAEPGARLMIYDGESELGETTADEEGNWRFQLTDDLGTGEHTLRVVVVDEAGEILSGSPAAAVDMQGLLAALDAPVIFLPETGTVVAGDTVEGLAAPGSLLTIYDGETLLGEATADSEGQWNFRLPDDLGSGEHMLRALAVDDAGETLSTPPTAIFDMLELRLPVTGEL